MTEYVYAVIRTTDDMEGLWDYLESIWSTKDKADEEQKALTLKEGSDIQYPLIDFRVKEYRLNGR